MTSDRITALAHNLIWIGTLCCAFVYLAFPPLLWLPFAPVMRHGYRSPMIAIVFTPDRILFDRWETYRTLIHWESRLLGINDLDYEYIFLGSWH